MGVRASLGSPTPAVPGEMAHCELTVVNTGERAEDVRLELGGEPAAWGWITPPTLQVPAGGSGMAWVTFKVPRGPHVPAGPLGVTVSIVTEGDPGRLLTVDGTLDVAPLADVRATLDPHTSRGRDGRHVLRVENRGNAGVSARVEGEGDEVSVRAEPDLVELGPGASTEVQVTARAGRQPFRGGTVTRTFAVLVGPDGPGSPGRAEGAVELAPAGWTGRVALAVVVLAVAAVGLRVALLSAGGGSTDAPAETAAPPPPPSDCPARDHLSPDANGIVREGVQPSFDYTFLFVSRSGCQPVRFNPCEPVRYALNRRLATDAHVDDLLEGLSRLAEATGLQFQRVTDSDEDPRLVPRPRRQPDGTLGWPPVVIGWAHLGTGDSLRGSRAARPGPDVVVGGGGRPEVVSDVIVTGNLVLNLDAVTDTDTGAPVPHGFGPGVNWGRIILHELAHVIGLGHVESRTSIMNEALTQQTISSAQWGIGDLAGLRQLGREAGCVTVPPVPLQGAPR